MVEYVPFYSYITLPGGMSARKMKSDYLLEISTASEYKVSSISNICFAYETSNASLLKVNFKFKLFH